MKLMKINKKQLMADKPELLAVKYNSYGQRVYFYKNPKLGDEGDILGVIGNVAFHTGFLDMGDFRDVFFRDVLPAVANGEVFYAGN